MENNTWYSVVDLSLALAARESGYDISMFSSYPVTMKTSARKAMIKEAIDDIRLTASDEYDVDVDGIRRGVYVITLSNPLSIQYRKNNSQIIYIGMGNILGRLKSHFEKSLFDLMESLSGANFDFHFCQPFHDGNEDYYKHIEFLMLSDFSKNIGGLSDLRSYPILNKNAGSDRGYGEGDRWWRKPLKNSGKSKMRWALLPTKHSSFSILEDE